MVKSVSTQDAKAALREIIKEDVQAAAGGNDLVSRKEVPKLQPYLQAEQRKIRKEGGPGTQVHVDKLVERATTDANKVWDRFNPPGHGANSATLSQNEIKQIAHADKDLGKLTELAVLRAGQRGKDPVAAVKDYFNRFDFTNQALQTKGLPSGSRVDARVGQPGRQGVAENVLKAFDYYYRAEAADWASVGLYTGKIAGHEVNVIYMTTDGDDAYLEVLKKDGTPLASARLYAEKLLAWDEFFGRARLSPNLLYLDDVQQTDGYSEPADRLAAGQIPVDWNPDVSITSATLNHRDHQLTTVDLGSAHLTETQQQLAYAALGLLWERTLGQRTEVNPSQPLDLARCGQVRLGTFVSPKDQESYLVADWKDIDDDSFTFYFKNRDHGLSLAIQQYNN